MTDHKERSGFSASVTWRLGVCFDLSKMAKLGTCIAFHSTRGAGIFFSFMGKFILGDPWVSQDGGNGPPQNIHCRTVSRDVAVF